MLRTVVGCVVIAAVFAAPTFEEFRADPATFGWTAEPVPEGTTLHFQVFVKHNPAGVEALKDALMRMSDPDSPTYGQHLPTQAVHGMTAPSFVSVRAVKAWLRSHGVADSDVEATENSDILSVELPVATVESMLNARYMLYRHTSGNTIIRTLSYALPQSVAEHVDMVSPTIRFPHVFTNTAPSASDNLGVTPSSLRSLLKIGSATGGQASSNSQAAMAFLNQYISNSDVEQFFKQYAPSESGKTFTIIGPNQQGEPGIEASLDVEYIMSIGSDVPTTFWSVAGQQPGNPANEPFLAWLEAVAKTADDKVPRVFSASYGDNEPGVEYAYANRVNAEFMKLGARGVSIMFSSGDGGVGGGQPTSCTTFIPTFPAGSPYVTAVGGSNEDGTSAASLSSGGFANYFSRPAFQDDAVNHYLSTNKDLPDSSLFNKTGAGIPDVAAPALGFSIVYEGSSVDVAGTSCAAPTFSGVVSLVNDARLAAGKASLGYLNPFLYKNADLFQDITSGNNPGCGTEGFTAQAGWDPVTGLGLPDYAKWVAAAMELP